MLGDLRSNVDIIWETHGSGRRTGETIVQSMDHGETILLGYRAGYSLKQSKGATLRQGSTPWVLGGL